MVIYMCGWYATASGHEAFVASYVVEPASPNQSVVGWVRVDGKAYVCSWDEEGNPSPSNEIPAECDATIVAPWSEWRSKAGAGSGS